MRLLVSKRGEVTFTLQRLIEIIIGVMILIGLLAFLVTLIVALTFKEPTMEENDFNRVLAEVNSLKEDSGSIVIPIFSNDLRFELLKTPQAMYGCDKESICLCYYKEGKVSPVDCKGSSLDPKLHFNVVPSPNKREVEVKNHKLLLNVNGKDINLEEKP